jgi:ribosomal-protein-alanine N-acetyltransferase
MSYQLCNHQDILFRIDSMTLADIPAVVVIEQATYPTWPQKAYDQELEHNRLAHYFVLRVGSSMAIIGLGGFWLMAGEAHIITIAIHSHWQGLGLGEWMLLALIEKGQTQGAKIATLEVRPSNQVAISLYQKYKFQEVGRRLGYYSDNGEDALILTTPLLLLPDYQAMLTRRKTKLWRRLAQIKVDKISQIS